MKMNIRHLHRQLAIALFLPLGLTACTGLAYRLGRSWFNLSKDFGRAMMAIHTGSCLGEWFSCVYMLLLSWAVVVLIVSGFRLINPRLLKRRLSSAKRNIKVRVIHQYGALFLLLPLLISAITGVMYHLSRYWLGLPKERVAILLQVHEGAYLGAGLKPLYVLLLGMALLLMFFTGWRMLRQRPA
ncbi:MAG: PepSY domain-containing protein [Cyanobacteria bacterium J003]|nr:MAG: PepSY domain-containing protein [Cyanobacteria bacterium J003]